MSGRRRSFAWACAVALGLPVQAQTVYRCGPDGAAYSAVPCKDGRPVDVDDARTAAQREQAQQAVRGDAAAAAALERARIAREAQPVAGAANLGPARPPVAPAVAAKRHAPAKRHRATARTEADPAAPDFRAVAPRPPKPAKRANAKPSGAAASSPGHAR